MLIERDVDGLMERTRHRPLVEKRLPPAAALVFGTSLAAIALPLLLLAGNALTGVLGGLAFVAYVAIYTPMKRTSPAALFVGPCRARFPPLMGWTAVTGHIDVGAVALFGILFLWQIPHFLAIALYRSEDYGRAGFENLAAGGGRAAHAHRDRGFLGGAGGRRPWRSRPLHIAGMLYSTAAACWARGSSRGAWRGCGARPAACGLALSSSRRWSI